MTEPIPTVLADDQRRRVAALRIAAEVYDHYLPRGGLLGPGPAPSPRQKVSHRVYALTTLATYVLDGAEAIAAGEEWAPGEEEADADVVLLPDGWALHDTPGPRACTDPACSAVHTTDTPCEPFLGTEPTDD